jgi:hypothetical protein
MKKLLLTVALVAAGTLAYGQGTVQFSNGGLYKLSTSANADGSVAAVMPLTAGYTFGLFYGIGESTSLTLAATLAVNSTSTAGLIADITDGKSPLTKFQVPTTSANETDVWIKIAGWNSSASDYAHATMYGESRVANVAALGPSGGPGINIWTTATGTNLKLVNAFVIKAVPEPSTMALAGLGAAALLIFRRRK